MRISNCFLLAALLSSAACAPPRFDTLRTYPPCVDGASIGYTVTINLRSVNPDPAPPHVCVPPNQTLTFRIVPRVDRDTVMTIAKGTNPDGGGPGNWLSAANESNPTEFTVTSLSRADAIAACGEYAYDNGECSFDYAIYAKDKRPLDPRVTVRR